MRIGVIFERAYNKIGMIRMDGKIGEPMLRFNWYTGEISDARRRDYLTYVE